MSFIAHGLRCDSCEERDPHVFFKRADGPPPCPACGGARSVDWSHGQFPGVKGDGYGSFNPVNMGVLGYCDTREKFDKAMSVIKERFPDKHIQIEHDSQTDKQIRIDEAKHRSHMQKKGHGLDSTILKEIKEKKKAIKSNAADQALRHNKDPAKARKRAKLGKSPAALVGSKIA